MVKAVVEAPLSHQISNGLANALEGLDPLAIDVCGARMLEAANYYGRVGVGTHAMAGVNLALWDIAGKARNCPAYELLGGPYQNQIPRVLLHPLRRHAARDPANWPAALLVKGSQPSSSAGDQWGRARQTISPWCAKRGRGPDPDVDILVDAGQVWDWKTGLKRAEQFAEYGIFWLEEPLHPEDVAGYAHLCERSPVPIATGEAESRYQDFERLLVNGRIDWVQPDPGRCGLSTMVEVGRLAHRLHRKVVNHSFKSGITIAASLHGLAAVPPRRGL